MLKLAATALLIGALGSSAMAACPMPGLEAAGDGRPRAPVDGPMSAGFGPRRHPLHSGQHHHGGQDFPASAGSPVRALEAGVAIYAGYWRENGNMIVIAHGKGLETIYTHLARSIVAEGACVARGDVIGEAGCTGLCAQPHVHVEIRKQGDPIDPTQFGIGELPATPPDLIELWRTVDRNKLLDAVVSATERHFIDKGLLERIAFKGKAEELRPALAAAATKEDVVRIVNEMLGALKTSHTGLYSPDSYEFYILKDFVRPREDRLTDPVLLGIQAREMPMPGIGVFSREIDGRHFVDGLLEGSTADMAGIRIGDEIVSVDGAPYRPISSFRGKETEPAVLEIRRSAGGPVERVGVAVTHTKPGEAFAAATIASARIIQQGGKRIGYIRVWAFNDARGFTEAFRKLYPARDARGEPHRNKGHTGAPGELREEMTGAIAEGTKGPPDLLIVDLRGKVGGSAAVPEQILARLDQPHLHRYSGDWRPDTIARWHPLRSGEPFVATPRPGPPTFRGRSVLLIDAHTRSAGEIMAYGYKRSGFGPVLGTRTAGAVVGGATFVMPGGLLLYLGIAGHLFDGKPLEAAGVEPDIVVERPLPYSNGADPVLEKALELLAARGADGG